MDELFSLDGHTALATGGTSGIALNVKAAHYLTAALLEPLHCSNRCAPRRPPRTRRGSSTSDRWTRIGRPEEIGGTVVYLASRAGAFTTATTTATVLAVDGGITGVR